MPDHRQQASDAANAAAAAGRFGTFLRLAVCTSFGLGFAPVMPGTVGTLPAVGIYLAIVLLVPAWAQTPALLAAVAVVCAACLAFAPWAERYWKTKDPQIFVADEVAGFLTTVLLFRTENVWATLAAAFVATRVLDIVKVPPARQLERLPGGAGILADDVCSSLYAAGLLHLLNLAWPGLMNP